MTVDKERLWMRRAMTLAAAAMLIPAVHFREPLAGIPGLALVGAVFAWIRFRLTDPSGPVYLRPGYATAVLVVLTAVVVGIGVLMGLDSATES